MKKTSFLFILFCVCQFAWAQNKPVIKTKVIKINKAQVDDALSDDQVPQSYFDTHCFIENTSKDPSFFLVSSDSTHWKEMSIGGRGTIDLPVSNFVYMKIWTTETDYFTMAVYPKNYYQIVYDRTLKKWVFHKH